MTKQCDSLEMLRSELDRVVWPVPVAPTRFHPPSP
jgi:hypothetical protein